MPRRTIDIAFTRWRLAVFVDGCFWHGCAEHRGVPKVNSDWWRKKLEINRIRDDDTKDHLERIGWQVIRVWEHEEIAEVFERVTKELAALAKDRMPSQMR